jgi:TolA-binding protein
MAMSDRLDRALGTLREDATGANPRSDATLDRILASRRRAAPSWPKRARLWVPIAAVLVIATTALARSGAVPRIRALVTGAADVRETGRVAAQPPAPSVAGAPAPDLATEPAQPVASAPSAAPAVASGPEPTPAHELAPSPEPVLARPRATPPEPSTRAPILAPASPAEQQSAPPPRGPSEADIYARAHKLHFEGSDPGAALTAWDDYLSSFPGGRFAPDARYNRAIDLLKLKRYAEARTALAPFADGTFGGYHADDARELLRSIP